MCINVGQEREREKERERERQTTPEIWSMVGVATAV